MKVLSVWIGLYFLQAAMSGWLKKLGEADPNWQTNTANLKKYDFQRKLICQIWNCHWICGIETSPGVVSDLDFEFRLALHTKWGKVKLAILTVSLKKCDFLQTTQNISNIIYIYIYQIEVREMLVKNLGPYLKNQLLLAKKWPKSHDFMMEPRQKCCDSLGMMGMDRKISSRAVEWRWNHRDPKTR